MPRLLLVFTEVHLSHGRRNGMTIGFKKLQSKQKYVFQQRSNKMLLTIPRYSDSSDDESNISLILRGFPEGPSVCAQSSDPGG